MAVDFLSDEAVQYCLSRLAYYIGQGGLRPLPNVVHDLTNVRNALRQMSLARHVGKIVVRTGTLQQRHADVARGTVAITGGFGMIGSLLAGWLARQSIGGILLLGRSGRGASAEGAVALAVAGSCVPVTMRRCDAGSAAEVAAAAASLGTASHLQVRYLVGMLWLGRWGLLFGSLRNLPTSVRD